MKKGSAAFAIIFIVVLIVAILFIVLQSASESRSISRQSSIENTQREFLGSYGEMLKSFSRNALKFSATKATIELAKKGLGQKNRFLMVDSIPYLPNDQVLLGRLSNSTITYCGEYFDALDKKGDFGKLVFDDIDNIQEVRFEVDMGNLFDNYNNFYVTGENGTAKVVSAFNNEERTITHEYKIALKNRFFYVYDNLRKWVNLNTLSARACRMLVPYHGFDDVNYFKAGEDDVEKMLDDELEHLNGYFDGDVSCSYNILCFDHKADVICGNPLDCDNECTCGYIIQSDAYAEDSACTSSVKEVPAYCGVDVPSATGGGFYTVDYSTEYATNSPYSCGSTTPWGISHEFFVIANVTCSDKKYLFPTNTEKMENLTFDFLISINLKREPKPPSDNCQDYCNPDDCLAGQLEGIGTSLGREDLTLGDYINCYERVLTGNEIIEKGLGYLTADGSLEIYSGANIIFSVDKDKILACDKCQYCELNATNQPACSDKKCAYDCTPDTRICVNDNAREGSANYFSAYGTCDLVDSCGCHYWSFDDCNAGNALTNLPNVCRPDGSRSGGKTQYNLDFNNKIKMPNEEGDGPGDYATIPTNDVSARGASANYKIEGEFSHLPSNNYNAPGYVESFESVSCQEVSCITGDEGKCPELGICYKWDDTQNKEVEVCRGNLCISKTDWDYCEFTQCTTSVMQDNKDFKTCKTERKTYGKYKDLFCHHDIQDGCPWYQKCENQQYDVICVDILGGGSSGGGGGGGGGTTCSSDSTKKGSGWSGEKCSCSDMITVTENCKFCGADEVAKYDICNLCTPCSEGNCKRADIKIDLNGYECISQG